MSDSDMTYQSCGADAEGAPGEGDNLSIDLSAIRDLKLFRRAVREGWPIADHVRELCAAKLGIAVGGIDPSTERGARLLMHTLQTINEMDRQGLAELATLLQARQREAEQATGGQGFVVNIRTKGTDSASHND